MPPASTKGQPANHPPKQTEPSSEDRGDDRKDDELDQGHSEPRCNCCASVRRRREDTPAAVESDEG